jgi:hypothetical protein
MSRPTPHQLAGSASEDGHQTALFGAIASGVANKTLNEKLRLLYAIPNGGKRGDSERSRMIAGGRLKATGVKAGVPDVHLPVARRGYHSLYIELKRPKSERGRAGSTQLEQVQWHEDLRAEGHYVVTCFGWEAALEILNDYLA